MRTLLCIFGGPLAGAVGGLLLGLLFNSGVEATLREEITVYMVVGTIAGLVLGITTLVLTAKRVVSMETVRETKSSRMPAPGIFVVYFGTMLGIASGCAVPWILPYFVPITLGAIPGALLGGFGAVVGHSVAKPIGNAINELLGTDGNSTYDKVGDGRMIVPGRGSEDRR